MLEGLEERILAVPESDEARVALASMLRLQRAGKSPDEIAFGLEAETGMRLAPSSVERILRQLPDGGGQSRTHVQM